jgi:predicted  nucleic acid-binding Zn-ribbon protein
MHEDALKLYALWRLDVARDAFLQESRALKARIAAEEQALVEAAANQDAAEQALTAARELERELNRKVDSYTKRRDRAQKSIDTGVATDFHAAQRQVEQCAELLDGLETDLLEAMDGKEQAETTLERSTSVHGLVASRLAAAQKAYTDRRPALKVSFDAVTVERDAARGEVWRDQLSRYDGLRKKGWAAFARVRDGNCGGCNVRLNGVDLSAHRRAIEFVWCPNCGRALGDINEDGELTEESAGD